MLLGLCLSVNCAAEIPVFYFNSRILARLGVLRAFHLAMAAFILRLACYAVWGGDFCRSGGFFQSRVAAGVGRGRGRGAEKRRSYRAHSRRVLACVAGRGRARRRGALPPRLSLPPFPGQVLPALGNPWLVLGAEALQGATFALSWSAACVHVKNISPRHVRSTVQVSRLGLRSPRFS